MKTMTCRQMGGSCDAQFEAKTADEMMNHGAEHIRDWASKGDQPHQKTLQMMQETQKNPVAGKEWNSKFQRDFAALPDAKMAA
jgi:predicted small metal-binding protein